MNGSATADATLLDISALSPFDKNNSPPSGPADKTMFLIVNQTDVVTWVIDREPFTEPSVPIVYGDISSGWNSNTTRHLPLNSTIDIIMSISNQSMDTVRQTTLCSHHLRALPKSIVFLIEETNIAGQMGHPVHLHGHKFWVLGSGVGSFPYEAIADAPADLINIQDPPYRDTTGLPSQGWAAIR